MQRRPLGPSDIPASVVGLGAWAIGGWMWGGTDEKESIRTIHAAIDAGIALIDTAPIYGFGLSEQIVGRAIKDRRDSVVLATKCGMVTNTRAGRDMTNATVAGPDPDGHLNVRIHLSPESIQREVETSLRRLQTDHIDLYQTHWQEPTTPREETMAKLVALREKGLIRAIGVCNASSDEMKEYQRAGVLDSDQERFSMLDRQIEGNQLPFARENSLAVLAYSPIAQGLLTGKMGPEREFPDGDLRRDNPRFSVENRKRVRAMLDEVAPIAEAHGITLAQLAIAWTFHQPGLTHALVGARREAQAQENAAAGDVQLTRDELDRIEAALSDLELAGS